LQPDGTVHFLMPASRFPHREGGMHFSLTATDQLGLTAVRAANQINVDAVPPTFTAPPHVVYSSATPLGACGPADSAGAFACGRQAGTHALRDDTVTVTFDGVDCGAGLSNSGSPAGLTLSVTSGGQTKSTGVQKASNPTSGACANGSQNNLHHYTAQISFADLAPSLDASASDGTVQVRPPC